MQSKLQGNRERSLPLGMKISQLTSRADRLQQGKVGAGGPKANDFQNKFSYKFDTGGCNAAAARRNVRELGETKSSNPIIAKICSDFKKKSLLSQSLFCKTSNTSRLTRKSIIYRDVVTASSSSKFQNFENFVRLYGNTTILENKDADVEHIAPKIEHNAEDDSNQFHFTPKIAEKDDFSLHVFDSNLPENLDFLNDRIERDDTKGIEEVHFSRGKNDFNGISNDEEIDPWLSDVSGIKCGGVGGGGGDDDDDNDEDDDDDDDEDEYEFECQWNESILSQELSSVSEENADSKDLVEENLRLYSAPSTPVTAVTEVLNSGSEVVFREWEAEMPVKWNTRETNKQAMSGESCVRCPLIGYMRGDGSLVMEEISSRE